MRAVLQRVTRASVSVEEQVVGAIGLGLLVLLGVEQGDTDRDVQYIAQKIANVRIFSDSEQKMNLSILQTGGAVLMVSQFTLLGDARKGRRPGFTQAEAPQEADRAYEAVCAALEDIGVPVQRGQFRAHMQVQLVNDGPVTLLLDSRKLF